MNFFIASFFLVTLLSPLIRSQNQEEIYKKNPNYSRLVESYKNSNRHKVKIAMLGNSITYGGNWEQLLNRDDIINRGIPSDITRGFLRRVDEIISRDPKYCFILGGVNDIYEDIPVDSIAENIFNVASKLRNNNIIPVIQSTLFVSSKWKKFSAKNLEIEKLNNILKNFCRENDIAFIDLNEKFGYDGKLKEELTSDGVHLNEEGYLLWSDILEEFITKNNI